MLTAQECLQTALRAGRVVAWTPTNRGLAMRQVLAIDKDTHDYIQSPWGDDESKLERRRQKLLSVCDAFVGEVTAIRALFKQRSKKLGIAEMKAMSPRPGLRLLGAFLSDSVFVAASLWQREDLPFKHLPDQTGKIDHRSLNEKTADDLKLLLGEISFHCPPALR